MLNIIKKRKGSLFCVVLSIICILLMSFAIEYDIETKRDFTVQLVALILNVPSLVLNGINLFHE